MRDKDNYNDNIEFVIYGITEPYTNEVVYIGLYIYDWNDMDEYPKQTDIIKDGIAYMKDTDNVFWKDVNNMFCYHIDHADYNRILTGVVVLERYYETDRDPHYLNTALKYWKDIFKPKYNIGDKVE